MKFYRVLFAFILCLTAFSVTAQNTYTVSLAGQTSDTISRAAITANPVLMIADSEIPVASFEFTYLNGEGDLITFAVKDNVLNYSALKAVADPIVKKIFIENAKFMLNGVEITAKAKAVYIRD